MALQKTGHNISVNLGASAPTLYCKSMALPGIEGGDPIDVTSLQTTKFTAKVPGDLGNIPDLTLSAMFDPSDYTKVMAVVNSARTITFTLAATTNTALNGVGNRTEAKTISAYGWVCDFIPQDAKTGEVPEAQLKLCFAGGTTTGATEGTNTNSGITVA